MKRITNWLLTLLFGTTLGVLAERMIFGRSSQEKIISLKAELNAMRGQLRASEQKVAGKSAEILNLESRVNNYTQQLSTSQQEASQLRAELSNAQSVSDIADAQDAPQASDMVDEAVMLSSDDYLPASALAGEAVSAEQEDDVEMPPFGEGVEDSEAYVSDDLEVQSAEAEGMVMLPPDDEHMMPEETPSDEKEEINPLFAPSDDSDEQDDDVEELPAGGGVESSEEYVSDDLEVQSAESEGMVMLPPDAAQRTDMDTLQEIEGIGPKREAVLIAAGVTTFMQIADMSEEELGKVFTDAEMRRPNSIGSWAEQALLAAADDWDALRELQKDLVSGRRRS